jgi:hypothetical protein
MPAGGTFFLTPWDSRPLPKFKLNYYQKFARLFRHDGAKHLEDSRQNRKRATDRLPANAAVENSLAN